MEGVGWVTVTSGDAQTPWGLHSAGGPHPRPEKRGGDGVSKAEQDLNVNAPGQELGPGDWGIRTAKGGSSSPTRLPNHTVLPR